MKAGIRSHLWNLLLVIFLVLAPSVSLAGIRIGVIMSGDIPYYGAMHEAFVNELRARIPVNENVEIILQRPFPDSIAWSNAARKLIAVEVDLIVTYGSPATLAVLQEKSPVPVVYAGVYDPGNAGVKGNKVTGCGFKVPLSSLLRYFKRLKKVDACTVVFSGIEEDSVRQKEEFFVLAKSQNITLKQIDIRSMADLEQLRDVASDDAVLVTGSSLAHLWINHIMSILRQHKVPVGSIFPDSTGSGVLISLFQPPEDQGKAAAAMAAKILHGEQPSAIAPELLRETELVFNLVEAQQVGITFPVQLIVEATRVIK